MYKPKPNQQGIINKISENATAAKNALKELAEYIRNNPNAKTPPPTYDAIKTRLKLLAESVREFRLIKTGKDAAGNTVETECTVFEALNDIANTDRGKLTEAPKDEFDLYKELGISLGEYEEIILTHIGLIESGDAIDYEKAFDEFVNAVLKNDSKDDWKELVRAGGGLISIAGDITAFVVTSNAVTLYFSCATGLSAIAISFKKVGKAITRFFKRRRK